MSDDLESHKTGITPRGETRFEMRCYKHLALINPYKGNRFFESACHRCTPCRSPRCVILCQYFHSCDYEKL